MFHVHRIAEIIHTLSRVDFVAGCRKATKPNLLSCDDSHMTSQSLVLDHFKQHRRNLPLLKRITTNVDQSRRRHMAKRKDQVGEIAIFAYQDPVFISRALYMFDVAGRGTNESGTKNIMTIIRQGMRDVQTNVDVEQEFQAALAWPIAA